jgi:integrase
MGSIKKRPNGMWRARYRDPQGREHAHHFERKVDAERWLVGVEQSKLVGNYIDPNAGKVTFKVYAEEWRKLQVHREGTATSVEQHLRLHIYPSIGDRPLAAIRQSEVQALVKRISKTLAPSTVGVVYSRVSAVFRAAVRDRIIAATPCVEVKLPKVPPASVLEVLSTDQVKALAAAVPDRYRALVIAHAGLGLRPGELFGLRVDCVDFLRRTVRVEQQPSVRAPPIARPPSGTTRGRVRAWRSARSRPTRRTARCHSPRSSPTLSLPTWRGGRPTPSSG